MNRMEQNKMSQGEGTEPGNATSVWWEWLFPANDACKKNKAKIRDGSRKLSNHKSVYGPTSSN